MAKRKVSFAGTEVEVEDIEPISSTEHFNDYELPDGTSLRVKSVLTTLVRVVGQTTPDGQPLFLATVTPVVVVRKTE